MFNAMPLASHIIDTMTTTAPVASTILRPTRRPAKLALSSVLLSALLAGCSLTPEFVRPDLPVPTSYPADSAASPEMAAPPDWKTFFQDPELRSLIGIALENNRDLRTAALRIEEARAQYNVQSADLLPNLNGTSTVSRARSPFGGATTGTTTGGTTGTTGGTGVTSGSGRLITTYQVGVSLAAFELDFFGRVRSLNEAALSQFLATTEARRSAQISLIAEVARAYLAERAFAEQLLLARQTVEARKKGFALAKKRFDVGVTSALDLRLNETLVQSARVSLLTLTRQRAQAENALALLIGAPVPPQLLAPGPLMPGKEQSGKAERTTKATQATTAKKGTKANPKEKSSSRENSQLIPQQTATLFRQDIVTDIPAGVPSELLTRRPDIIAAELRLRAANGQIGAARAAFFPRIALTAGLGTASTELGNLFEAGSRTWSFVPQLVLPIFDGGRNRGNLNLAQVRKEIAINDYEETIQTAFREVADALAARGLLEEQIEAQRLVQEAQAERLRLAELRFSSGVSSSLDVLDAQRELFIAQQQLVQARLLRLTNSIDLYRALGGGVGESAPVPALSSTSAR